MARYNDLVKTVSLAEKKDRLAELDKIMEQPDFWNNDKQAQQVIKEKKQLLLWVEPMNEINKQLSAVGEMIEDVVELNDDELTNEFSQTLTKVEEKINTLETTLMLSGDFDKESCYLTINAGAGGTESCDWAQMLFRMYERWASQRDFDVEVIDVQDGDVAGIKSATILIKERMRLDTRRQKPVSIVWFVSHHLTVIKNDIQVLHLLKLCLTLTWI